MAETEKDLVCGMDVDPQETPYKSEYNGKMYYFCSMGCKKDFDKEPDRYIGKTGTKNLLR